MIDIETMKAIGMLVVSLTGAFGTAWKTASSLNAKHIARLEEHEIQLSSVRGLSDKVVELQREVSELHGYLRGKLGN